MTNETIEKIYKILKIKNKCLACINKKVPCNKCLAEMIYEEIVEPLESEKKELYDENCNLQLYIDNHEKIWSANTDYWERKCQNLGKELKELLKRSKDIIEANTLLLNTVEKLEHKNKLLERALKLCIEDCLDETTPFMGDSEYYIQQAEARLKELKGEQ